MHMNIHPGWNKPESQGEQSRVEEETQLVGMQRGGSTPPPSALSLSLAPSLPPPIPRSQHAPSGGAGMTSGESAGIRGRGGELPGTTSDATQHTR